MDESASVMQVCTGYHGGIYGESWEYHAGCYGVSREYRAGIRGRWKAGVRLLRVVKLSELSAALLSGCRRSYCRVGSLKFKVKNLKWEKFRRGSKVVTLPGCPLKLLSRCRVAVVALSDDR